jgi:hypothetical protein
MNCRDNFLHIWKKLVTKTALPLDKESRDPQYTFEKGFFYFGC